MPVRTRTLPLDHPLREQVEAAFGFGPFESIEHVARSQGGACYWNVEEHVCQYGGKAQHGWKIQIWPGLFAVAVHHSVWVEPARQTLVDITGKLPSDTEPDTTFVSDPSCPIDLTRAPFIPDRYHLISETAEVRELLKAETDKLNHQRALADLLFAAGAKWRPIGGYELPNHLIGQFCGQFAEAEKLSLRVLHAIEACDH